jgi:hypothetical protein
MMNAIHQDIDLWEVWIEFDQSHPEFFGTLYVHGEVTIDKKMRSSLTRIDSKDNYQLHLQLPARSASFRYTKEVLYSEPIRNPNQYTSVCIYAGEELVGCFNEIEIMI